MITFSTAPALGAHTLKQPRMCTLAIAEPIHMLPPSPYLFLHTYVVFLTRQLYFCLLSLYFLANPYQLYVYRAKLHHMSR